MTKTASTPEIPSSLDMTLTDYFAAQIVSQAVRIWGLELGTDRMSKAARFSYDLADAMMAERDRRG